MKSGTKQIGGTALVVLCAGLSIAAAAAMDTDDGDAPITGSAFYQARAAALAYTGEGRVTGTEVGDEESYYEVEVTLDDASQVDVQLDEKFRVVEVTNDGGPED